MLDSALSFLANELNGYIKQRTGALLNIVEVGAIADDQGKWAIAEGQLRLALINIEEERTLKSQLPERAYIEGQYVMLQPNLKLNLVIMCAARLKNYSDSLRYLSYILMFFQSHPSFASSEYPGLDSRIEKLNVEMMPSGTEQLNQMWAYIGTKYLPSVVYRIRLIALQDNEAMGIGQPITSVNTVVHSL
ncbi:MAG: DUF4255 domain-containing protein [Pseudomonadota bacterium]